MIVSGGAPFKSLTGMCDDRLTETPGVYLRYTLRLRVNVDY